MSYFYQRRTQDCTLLLDCLVTITEEWLANLQAWHKAAETCKCQREACEHQKEIHKQERDQEEWAHHAQVLEVEERNISVLKRMMAAQDSSVLSWAVKAM